MTVVSSYNKMKSQSYHNFRQRIHQAAKEKSFPLRVMFELTYRCNFQCKHCYVPQRYQKYKELETKEVFSILDQLKDIGCFYLGFTGGEPFMRDDIMEILRYAKRCGFELIIYTNGSLINEKIAGQLGRLRPNKVDITIPAMSKDAFERINGVSGSRDRVFRAIDLLHKKGVNLGFKTCVLKENENEIDQIQDFASSLNALHRFDDMLLPRLDGSKEPYRYRGRLKDNLVTSHKSQVTGKREFIDCNLDALIETEHRTPNTDKLFKCGVGVSQAAITPSGELKMCLMIDYPKYQISDDRPRLWRGKRQIYPANGGTTDNRPQDKGNGMSLKDVWQKLRESVKSIKPDENYRCNQCELEPYCKWCPARGWLENRNFTGCDPESRHWAEIRKKNYADRG